MKTIIIIAIALTACQQQAPPNPMEQVGQTGLAGAVSGVAATQTSRPSTGGDFRGSNWGMSPDEVGLSPAHKLSDDPPTYANADEPCAIPGRSCFTSRTFLDGGLVQGMFMFYDDWSNHQQYISDVHEFTELLSQKYGAPAVIGDVWKRDLYRDDPMKHGFAMSMGDLAMGREWRTDRTVVRLTATGNNFKVNITIGYFSKAHEARVMQAWDNRNSRGL